MFGQNDRSRIALDLFLWQELFRLKWVSKECLCQLFSGKDGILIAIYGQKICVCALITFLAIAHSYTEACILIYLPALLKDRAWSSAMARKQAKRDRFCLYELLSIQGVSTPSVSQATQSWRQPREERQGRAEDEAHRVLYLISIYSFLSIRNEFINSRGR